MSNSHITFKENRKQVFLHNDEILFIKSGGDYLRLITPGRLHFMHCTIKSMAAQVDPAVFVRVHRCFIINLRKVSAVKDNVLIIDGKPIPVSKRYMPDLLSKLNP